MRKYFFLFIFVVAFLAGAYTQRVSVMDWYQSLAEPVLPEPVEFVNVPKISEQDVVKKDVAEEALEKKEEMPVQEETVVKEEEAFVIEPVVEEVRSFPASINLAVAFTPQAPRGTWGEPYQEGCEEASIYMVSQFFEGTPAGRINVDTADEALLSIVSFEQELFGYYEDTNVEQTAVLAEMMFGYTGELIENPTVDDIKAQLVAGRPVLVPSAGRLLGNPYFTAPGPIYHMLVIRGYTDGKFIVNDPGTSHGEAYLYDFDTIMNAMHDWNNRGEITQGRKVVLVLNP